jgi:16S rRNA (cytosine1402-N4)-methyltransferase
MWSVPKSGSDLARDAHEGAPHVPVLIGAVLDALGDISGMTIIDGTFGAGGYTREFLKAGAQVTAIDRDPSVAPHVAAVKSEFGESFQFLAGRFSQIDSLIEGAAPDAIVLDIGVSSMQLDQDERGFSFMKDGPLDMRMSREGVSAAELVNELPERELADLIFGLGEERKSRAIAKAICAARQDKTIETTGELAAIIEGVVPRRPGAAHPATRTFQALRIAVNREFNELVDALFAAEAVLEEGGVLAVVTFHSLEDRIVKRFLKPQEAGSRHLPVKDQVEARWDPVAKPVKAGKSELDANPRARSATLRAATRTAAPAREISYKGLGVPGYALKEVRT